MNDTDISLQFVGGLILKGDVSCIFPESVRLYAWVNYYLTRLTFKYVFPSAVYNYYKLFDSLYIVFK